MGPIPEHCITFQQDISKPYLFLFKPGGRGDTEISGLLHRRFKDYFMNLVLNNLDLEKSTNHGQGYIAKLGEGFPPTSVWFSGFAAVFLVSSLEAGFAPPDPSAKVGV